LLKQSVELVQLQQHLLFCVVHALEQCKLYMRSSLEHPLAEIEQVCLIDLLEGCCLLLLDVELTQPAVELVGEEIDLVPQTMLLPIENVSSSLLHEREVCITHRVNIPHEFIHPLSMQSVHLVQTLLVALDERK